jgi:hypothetical protein
MERLRRSLVSTLLLIPSSAFAHGGQVLVTFSIQLMSIFIFLFVLVTLKATLKRKLILTGVYILAVVLT